MFILSLSFMGNSPYDPRTYIYVYMCVCMHLKSIGFTLLQDKHNTKINPRSKQKDRANQVQIFLAINYKVCSKFKNKELGIELVLQVMFIKDSLRFNFFENLSGLHAMVFYYYFLCACNRELD